MLRDRRILYATAFLRALATGMMGVLLGIYLARMAFTPSQIGLVISSGLAGATLGGCPRLCWIPDAVSGDFHPALRWGGHENYL